MTLIPQVFADCTGIGCPLPSSISGFTTKKIGWDTIVSNVVSTLFFLAAISTLIFMLWGGIGMITSGGDKGKFETGRNRLVFAVIGMIVVASSYAIWLLVMRIVGMEKLNTGVL